MTILYDKLTVLGEVVLSGKDALDAIFKVITNGVTITDEQSRIIYVNPAFTTITGYEAKEVIGDNPGMLHSGRHGKKYYQKMWKDLIKLGHWQGEIWNRRKSGEIFPELLTITKVAKDRQRVFYIGIFSDITFLVQENATKINLAMRDPLTGLCNRSLLQDRFDVFFETYKRSKSEPNIKVKQGAFLFIDLDHFKKINDTYGHLIGDSVLMFVAKVLKTCSRAVDTIARVGGDEFAVLLTDTDSKMQVKDYCNRVRKSLDKGIYIDDLHIVPFLSIGVCFFPTEATEFQKLTAYADKAMYHAKQKQSFLTFYSDLN